MDLDESTVWLVKLSKRCFCNIFIHLPSSGQEPKRPTSASIKCAWISPLFIAVAFWFHLSPKKCRSVLILKTAVLLCHLVGMLLIAMHFHQIKKHPDKNYFFSVQFCSDIQAS